jgi:hypothetical protein
VEGVVEPNENPPDGFGTAPPPPPNRDVPVDAPPAGLPNIDPEAGGLEVGVEDWLALLPKRDVVG